MASLPDKSFFTCPPFPKACQCADGPVGRSPSARLTVRTVGFHSRHSRRSSQGGRGHGPVASCPLTSGNTCAADAPRSRSGQCGSRAGSSTKASRRRQILTGRPVSRVREAVSYTHLRAHETVLELV